MFVTIYLGIQIIYKELKTLNKNKKCDRSENYLFFKKKN